MKNKYIFDEEYKKMCDEAVELYKQGYDTTELAEKYGVHKTTILFWLRRQGVERRTRKKYSYELICEIGELWENTDTPIYTISEKYKISEKYIRQLMLDYDFKRGHLASKGRYKQTPIVQLDTEGKIVAIYDSLNQSARDTGISINSIFRCVNGYKRHKTAGGYKWMKLEQYDKELAN